MRKFLVGSVVVVFGFFLLICLGAFTTDLLFNLAFGWVFYCYQTLPQVRFDAGGLLTAVVCLAALAAGLHAFLRWLFAHISAAGKDEESTRRPWPMRWTVAILAMIVLMFFAGLAAVGISHQTAWLFTSPEWIYAGTIREVSARVQSGENVQLMALAMHGYQDEKKVLPPAALWSKDGRPLLSWRVLILPYIEQEDLFKEFHLTESWDSPHNLRLLPRMPKIYLPLLGSETAKPYTTRYQVFVGKGAAFEGRQGLHLPVDFPDGTANTMLIVEATDAVPWTKPDDLPYFQGQLLPALGSRSLDFFLTAMADGSVRQINRDVDESRLRGLITRNGRETPQE
ncbi:MAG TPA: DUF1559 domain-containing protein [Gemmataceae bacterium]|nr:DUF1559 domain-containing protein [Gemmataceae bacterium]